MVRINVGCGFGWKKEGWIGIDWDETSATWAQSGQTPSYVNVNVLEGLPFQNGSVDVVYASHMLEHFTFLEGMAVIAEFRRVLRPGGVLALVVPDLDVYLDRLAARDAEFLTTPDIIGGSPRNNLTDDFLMNFFSDPSLMNQCHKYSYNMENLGCLLEKFAFADIHRVGFQNFTYWPELNEDVFRCLAPHADRFSLSVECRRSSVEVDCDAMPDYLLSVEMVRRENARRRAAAALQTREVQLAQENERLSARAKENAQEIARLTAADARQEHILSRIRRLPLGGAALHFLDTWERPQHRRGGRQKQQQQHKEG